MAHAARPFHLAGLLALTLSLACPLTARAQLGEEEFVTGAASAAWDAWQKGLQAVLARDNAASDAAFGQLLALKPSPLRVAILEQRTSERTNLAGGVLMLEQDKDANALSANAKTVVGLLDAGREQRAEADDGWYFCRIGRFDVANANFNALLNSKPDPVALLEFAERLPDRTEVLLKVSDNPIVGDAANNVLRLLAEGERQIKADPTRIKQNIDRLGGPPRAFENGVARLKDSGEYAIPFLVEYLADASKKELLQPIVKTLPQIGRPALNPLVMSLRIKVDSIRRYLIAGLGQLGYWQAVPYLLAIKEDSSTTAEVRAAVDAALNDLNSRGLQVPTGMSAAEGFYRLARSYYDDQQSLRADPRLDTANIWYWRDNIVQPVAVPTAIFNEVMCMRCCEEALRLSPEMKPALALWLAANFRREAQLAAGAIDATRPDGYPPAAYFAQSAGPEYCLMALARGIDDKEPAVALGAIEALRRTSGTASMMGDAGGRNPLAEALSFPDRMVRIRAGMALASALPQHEFNNSQNLTPVLVEALGMSGGARNALVIDPDTENANGLAAKLRALGFNVAIDGSLPAGLQKVRSDLPGMDLIVLASDVQAPELDAGLKQIRSDFRFASTPTLVITKAGGRDRVQALVRADTRLGEISGGEDAAGLSAAIDRVSKAVGAVAITPESGLSLALESAALMNGMAAANSPPYRGAEAEAALIQALKSGDPALRQTAAAALTYQPTGPAQEAIAAVAMNAAEAEPMRVVMFATLADAAKRHGNHMSEATVKKLIEIAEGDANMVIRTGASQALGALNLPGNPASTIIRNQYNG